MKWQYRVAVLQTGGFFGGKFPETEIAHTLEEMGDQQWELVSALDTSQTSGATKDIVLLFKRPK